MSPSVRSAAVLALGALCGCGGLFYYPDREHHFSPEEAGLEKREILFRTEDGETLDAWFLPAKGETRGLIVQFHGNAQNISSHFASLAWLVPRGYSLFTFDYRGYGLSTGKPSPEGTHRDALAALARALELRPRGKPFIVYGQSLGGVIALRALADFPPRGEVDLVVMDSAFVSYKDMVQEKLASFWLTWPFSPLGRLFVSDRYASEPVVESLGGRLLVIHARRDPVVGFENGRKLHDLARCRKEFWGLDQGDHVGVFAQAHATNRERFVALLEEIRRGKLAAAGP